MADEAALLQQKFEAVQTAILHHVADSHTLKLPFTSVQLPPLLSLHGTMVLLAGGLLIAVCAAARRRQRADVPTGLGNALEAFVVFIRDEIAVRFLGPEDGLRMTPLFCSFFVFILTLNLLGLVPGLYAATSNISVTGALATVTLGFMVFGAIYRHGLFGFLKGFAPHGVPALVLLLLVPIEIVGLFVRAFALMIRLFANELAGHLVIFFLLGLVIIFKLIGAPFFIMGVFIYLLEVFVALLQAFIFTLLSAVFIGQRYHPEH